MKNVKELVKIGVKYEDDITSILICLSRQFTKALEKMEKKHGFLRYFKVSEILEVYMDDKVRVGRSDVYIVHVRGVDKINYENKYGVDGYTIYINDYDLV